MRSIEQADVAGKRVLVRVDYNVPRDENWRVTDTTRLHASLPTVRFLLERDAKLVLMSHRGGFVMDPVDREWMAKNAKWPDAKFDYWSEKVLMEYVAVELEKIVGRPVISLPDCIGERVKKVVQGMEPGQIVLLENLRFYKGEMANDSQFAAELASHGEIYVNDAFSVCHRPHASVVTVPKLLPSYAGFSLLEEVRRLDELLSTRERPFLLLLGGAKVSDKLGLIRHLGSKADVVAVGGGMANTLLKSRGLSVGKSKTEDDQLEAASSALKELEGKGKEVLLPEDLVVADKFALNAKVTEVAATDVPSEGFCLDIGPRTAARFAEAVRGARTLFWNGPMGVFEMPPFSRGTRVVCESLLEFKGKGVVGGGESAAALKRFAPEARVHVCTGGGASLQYLSGKQLPGLAALEAEAPVERKA